MKSPTVIVHELIMYRYIITNCVVIKLHLSLGAARLMSHGNLTLLGAPLSVVRLNDIYEGLDSVSYRPRAIKVQGIHKSTSESYLHVFFETRRISGGGEIELLDFDTEEGTAVIVFKDADSELT